MVQFSWKEKGHIDRESLETSVSYLQTVGDQL